ncbi:MAG: glucosamine-6-phosphate deaminase [Candidatus Paceibacteria bacterium]|jgi:glucosamine-6-phosphate deaminase
MEVIVVESAEELGRIGADAITRVMKRASRTTLGLATGSSPLPIYDELIRRHVAEKLSFEGTTACLLDEYLGLASDHRELYRAFIRRVFVDQVDLPLEQLLGPDVNSDTPESASSEYESCIRETGGVDLQLLGIGSDGHIGFNEPTSSLASRTRVKTLTAATRQDNARFFDGDLASVPKHAITQGIGTILEARHLLLVAQGAVKAASIAKAIEGPVTAMVPASALQLHAHVTVVVDQAAASKLEMLDYYRQTYLDKPDWQRI